MTEGDLALVEPSQDLSTAFLDLVEELRGAGEPLADMESLDEARFPAYLRRLHDLRDGIDLATGQVPMSTYWLVRASSTILGISRLRHRLTPGLREHGGHIGFVVRPSARRQGHGVTLLKLTLLRASGLGIEQVLVTCDADNHGSRRVIEANGGMLEDEKVSAVSGRLICRYWARTSGRPGPV